MDVSTYEIERGKPAPNKRHAIIQTKLLGLLYQNYPKYWALPELSLDLDGKEKIPDLSVYEKATFDDTIEEISVKQVPLTVIEILTPPQTVNELIEKSKVYFENGVKSYWLIVPVLKSVFVYYEYGTFVDFQHNEVLKDEVLGIELDLNKVF